MKSAGHDILTADSPQDAPPAPRHGLPRLSSEVDDAENRAPARRLAVVLMAASSLATLAILAGFCFLLWGRP